jgi:stage II sporulation protein D
MNMLKKLILQKSPKLLLFLTLWLMLIAPVQAALELRVAIKRNVNTLRIGSSTPAVVKDASGQVMGEIAAMGSFNATPNGGGVGINTWRSGHLWVEPSGDGLVWIGDQWYRGRVRLVRQGNGVTAVNYVDIEDYLYSVVGAEAIPSWHQEALKAQAVAARTYALYKRDTSKNSLYDLDTSTATQVYKGLKSEYTTTHDAVNATSGQVMTYNGKIILAVFHSSSGGHTENVEDVWTSPLPYLRGVVDYDQTSPVFQWQKSVSSSQVSRAFGGVGNIKAMVPEKTTPQGRVVTMKVVGDRGSKVVNGADIRKALDLRSTLFRVDLSQGSVQVNGRGFGHGLGLSQWGTFYLAQNGINYAQILGHYYQNARLATIQTR